MSVEGILANVLEAQENLIKVNCVIIKEILDSLIDVLGMCQRSIEKGTQRMAGNKQP